MKSNSYWSVISSGGLEENNSKWAFLDQEIALYMLNNSSQSDWTAAKNILRNLSLRFEYGDFKEKEKPSLEALRKYIHRLRTSLKKAVKSKVTEARMSIKKPINYLVIPDTHLPFEAEGLLEQALMICDKEEIHQVIHIGDIFDYHAISRYTAEYDSMSSTEEFDAAMLAINSWKKAFPEMIITTGNHDERLIKRIEESNLPSQIVKDINSVLGTPGWRWTERFVDEYYKIIFQHGTGQALSAALYSDYSIVQGHLHTEMYIKYITQNKFAAQIGCGINEEYYAFRYHKPSKSILKGLMVISDGVPRIVPLKE